YASIAYNASNEHVYAVAFKELDQAVEIHEFSKSGFVQAHTVGIHKEFSGFSIACAPDGTLYATSAEAERHETGPDVERWILKLDLDSGTSSIHAQQDLVDHCCPFFEFSVDGNGDVWWILNPDFWLYRVTPAGSAGAFACFTPIDSAKVLRDSEGKLFVIHPGGIDIIANQ
ncbi:MAG: hypothetical protein HN348_21845, partial [Proteobacteria bacterium]|nr:hypothetical protein [Pseudomonadota bacterium]